MALVDAACAAELNSMYENVKSNQNLTYIDYLNQIVDKHSQMAIPTMTNVSIKEVAGTLNITIVDAYVETLEIATKYMTYWSKAIMPTGIAVTAPMGGTIVSVVNDAMSYVSPLKAELDNAAKTVSEGVCYKKFCEILFKYAKQVMWIVTEVYTPPSSPPVTMVYNVNVT